MPPLVNYAGLFALGALVCGFLNLAIYRLAWFPRSISPWSPPPEGASPRRWSDRIPIVGWLGLRREAAIHGRGFWLRPMLIEVACGAGLAWLVWWEVNQSGLFLGQLMSLDFGFPRLARQIVVPRDIVYWQLVAHVALMAWMLVASFIDIDERIIPDDITVSGTVLGLLLAVVAPWSTLPNVDWFTAPPAIGTVLELNNGNPVVDPVKGHLVTQFVHVASPRDWPAALAGWPQVESLLVALGCYWFWIFAILPRRRRIYYRRRGLTGAVRLLTAQVERSFRAWHIRLLAPLGTTGVLVAWWLGGPRWAGLVTSLVGLAAGGGIVWAVRVIGSATLKKEAMGFGDVTLMMMIGALVGWQAALVIFFLAPLAGVVLGVAQLLFRRGQVIPYGPFLCLATVVVIVRWADVWNGVKLYFEVPWLVPGAVLFCFVLMGPLLAALHFVKTRYILADD